jgi:hypothetical protein
VLAVEVVSPSTRDNDVVAKFDQYHRIGIPLYVIIDQEKEKGPRLLRAYRRKPDRYVEIESDDRERIEVPPLGLMLGMRDNHVVCYDLRTGRELGDYTGITRALEESEQACEEAEQAIEEQVEARQDAARRADDARKEADRQRQEADNQRRAREELENQKMRAEELAAQRIRDLEEALRRLQAGGDAANPTA